MFYSTFRVINKVYYYYYMVWHRQFFPLAKVNTVFFFWLNFTLTHLARARNWKCPSQAVSGGENRGEGGRGYRERGQGKRKREGWGGCHTERMKERPTVRPTRSQSTHWCPDPAQKRSDTTSPNYTHLSVNSLSNAQHLEEDWRSRRCSQLHVFFPLRFFLFSARPGESAASLKF